ncbi:MAG: lipid-A-disaccharide synthase [Acidobacteria bacterium]|nr:lipid-A-disaccharide synthase [Acidobacteriota bacterium]MCY3964494.1 lipid-A-disaccharide synthase [Acidobacteriota bacterium]
MVAGRADSLSPGSLIEGSPAVLISAGEASGDHHAARMMEAARRLTGDGGRIRFFGLGGDAMATAGLEPVAHSDEVAVVGIFEVLRELPRIRRVFRRLLRAVEERRPELAVLVDFPDFNLRLARRLRRQGVPVLYYVSPQVWAWRRRRVAAIARLVKRMLVLFPFEVDVYRGLELEVEHVGHPLVDEVPEFASVWEQEADLPARARVALLPGSRNSEVRRILPPMLRAAATLASEGRDADDGLGRDGARVRLILAPTVDAGLVDRLVAASPLARQNLEIVRSGRFAALAGSHLALCASGTATLEVGLLGTPMVVVYRVSPLTGLIGRWLVDLPFISLVNLVLGRRVVPELLQGEAGAIQMAATARDLLSERSRVDSMRADLAELRPALGASGASERAARSLLRELGAVRESREGGRP